MVAIVHWALTLCRMVQSSAHWVLPTTLWGRYCCYSHFTDGETEALRGESNLPRVTLLTNGRKKERGRESKRERVRERWWSALPCKPFSTCMRLADYWPRNRFHCGRSCGSAHHKGNNIFLGGCTCLYLLGWCRLQVNLPISLATAYLIRYALFTFKILL